MCIAKQTETTSGGSEESTAGKQTKKRPKGKSVIVLRSGDVAQRGSTVFMPNTIEMARIKKPQTGQFQTGVQITSRMTSADVETKLKEIFSILKHKR